MDAPYPSMNYAQVVVHVPLNPTLPPKAESDTSDAPPYRWLDRSFTYHIPPELAADIRIGQLVWVPFGSRRLQGVVVDLSETTELAQTRDVESIVYPEPLLTLRQVELARWLAHRYLAPLADAVWLLLPPGIEDKVETFYQVAPDAELSALSDKQRALVERVREAGSLKSTALTLPQRGSVNTLVARGVLVKQSSVRAGKAKPKHADAVRLTVSPEAARAVIAGLEPRTAVLRALASAGAPLTYAELNAQVRTTPTLLAKLENEALVERVAPVVRYQLTARYHKEVPALPSEMARACVYLREHAPLATADELTRAVKVSPAALKRLVAQGWLESVSEPERFVLRGAPEPTTLTLAHARLLRLVEALEREPAPMLVSALYAATDAKRADLDKLEQLGVVAFESVQVIRDPLAGRTFQPVPPPTLTTEQARAWAELEPALDGAAGHAFLIHGVTGSGKTEIYLDAIDRMRERDAQAIVLVPEISLTPQTIRRFGARFGDRIGVLHSRLSAGERFDTWQRIRDGEIDVVIGARSALFAPLPRLGLVVIDEEHDASYKNDVEFPNAPAYHAREVALELARAQNVTVILGSATPDVETYARARRGEIHLLELPQRVIAPGTAAANGSAAPVHYQELPPVEIVDLRAELVAGNRSIFSASLKQALEETLARGEQAILFLNRRGTASAFVCRNCGNAVRCPRCHNPFTLHQFGSETARELVCHYCGKRAPLPKRCPKCGSTRIRGLGLGTEKLEEQVRAEFPAARTLRWDYDAAQGKDAHEHLLDAILRGEANVIIGTQMIAKGLDLPAVTLVGVVNADTALFLPDFRASERTFQLLTQVAGRAGRSTRAGRVILQTFNPDSYPIRAAARHDYSGFYQHELEFRRQAGYPPYQPLARLLLITDSPSRARASSQAYAASLNERIRRLGLLDVEVSGPTPAYFAKLRGKYRWQIFLKGKGAPELLAAYPPPPGWRIDIDPMDVL